MDEFVYIPLAEGFNIAFYDWDGLSNDAKFVGLQNFIDLFSDRTFGKAVSFSLLYTLVNLIIVNFIALLLAAILSSKKLKVGGIARTLLFSPNVISLVAVGLIWTFIFTQVFASFVSSTGWQWMNIDWFGGATSARIAIYIITGWVTCGYLMTIYIAGFNAIDTSIIEAAQIDGSSGLNLFFLVKFPLIMPSVVICVFWITLYSLKVFDIPFIVTSGGPFNSTTTLPIDIFNTAYMRTQYGYASAKSIVLFFIIMVITFFEVIYLKRAEMEE